MINLFLVAVLARVAFTCASDCSADLGGNQGWGLGFHEPDQYASVSSYFTASPYWPKQNITGEKESPYFFHLLSLTPLPTQTKVLYS